MMICCKLLNVLNGSMAFRKLLEQPQQTWWGVRRSMGNVFLGFLKFLVPIDESRAWTCELKNGFHLSPPLAWEVYQTRHADQGRLLYEHLSRYHAIGLSDLSDPLNHRLCWPSSSAALVTWRQSCVFLFQLNPNLFCSWMLRTWASRIRQWSSAQTNRSGIGNVTGAHRSASHRISHWIAFVFLGFMLTNRMDTWRKAINVCASVVKILQNSGAAGISSRNLCKATCCGVLPCFRWQLVEAARTTHWRVEKAMKATVCSFDCSGACPPVNGGVASPSGALASTHAMHEDTSDIILQDTDICKKLIASCNQCWIWEIGQNADFHGACKTATTDRVIGRSRLGTNRLGWAERMVTLKSTIIVSLPQGSLATTAFLRSQNSQPAWAIHSLCQHLSNRRNNVKRHHDPSAFWPPAAQQSPSHHCASCFLAMWEHLLLCSLANCTLAVATLKDTGCLNSLSLCYVAMLLTAGLNWQLPEWQFKALQ